MSDGGRDGETQITVDEEDAVEDEFDVEDRIVGEDTATSDACADADSGDESDADAVSEEDVDADAVSEEDVDADAVSEEDVDADAVSEEDVDADAVSEEDVDADAVSEEDASTGVDPRTDSTEPVDSAPESATPASDPSDAGTDEHQPSGSSGEVPADEEDTEPPAGQTAFTPDNHHGTAETAAAPAASEPGPRADAGSSEPESSAAEVSVEPPEELGTDATRLADELGRTQLRTTEEGYVKARVTDLERVDEETVRLLAELPAGGSASFRLRKPVPWSSEFFLTRLVEDAGYDAATVDHLVGEHVLVERGDPRNADGNGVWEEGSNSVVAQGRSLLQAIGLADLTDTEPRWRLVDPAEVDRGDSGRSWLPLLATLLVGTGVFIVSLLALPFLFLLTAISGGGVLVLMALCFVLYLAFVVGVLWYSS